MKLSAVRANEGIKTDQTVLGMKRREGQNRGVERELGSWEEMETVGRIMEEDKTNKLKRGCLLYTSPSPRD